MELSREAQRERFEKMMEMEERERRCYDIGLIIFWLIGISFLIGLCLGRLI